MTKTELKIMIKKELKIVQKEEVEVQKEEVEVQKEEVEVQKEEVVELLKEGEGEVDKHEILLPKYILYFYILHNKFLIILY